jgi:tetratricopeptide (TPR) repeat protein
MGSRLFQSHLAALMRQHHITGPRLAAATNYSRGYVWEVTTGRKPAVADFAVACDRALKTGGALAGALAAADPEAAGHWQRRQLLVDLGLLGVVGPVAGTEAARHGLGFALHGGADLEEWEEIAEEYAFAYARTPPARLLPELTADLEALGRQIPRAGAPAAAGLSRVGGQLAAIMAVALASTGSYRRARRWWRTANQLADRSGDGQIMAFVRGWEVVDGLYEDRPVAQILDRAAAATAAVGDLVCAGTAHVYAGLAQTLAVAGRREEALRALATTADLTERMPAAVLADEESLHGWPEVRLRHTESYVHTWLGNPQAAHTAQDEALRLYRPSLPPRQPTQVKLHRVGCMIREGDLAGGLAYAGTVLDELPPEHHNDHVYAVGRAALAFLPERERARRDAVEVRERLVYPPRH